VVLELRHGRWNGVYRNRVADQVALRLVAAQLGQGAQLLAILDAFSDDVERE
jgi:hypothetical protein